MSDHENTKQAQALAMILEHEQAVLARLAAWSTIHSEPRSRLGGLLRSLAAGNDPPLFGNTKAKLRTELALPPQGNLSADAQERTNTIYVDWTTQQFRALGCARREARVLAEQLVAMLHGAALIGHTLRAGELRLELSRIERWLDEAVANLR